MGLQGFVDLTVFVMEVGNIDRRRFCADFALVEVVADKGDVHQAVTVEHSFIFQVGLGEKVVVILAAGDFEPGIVENDLAVVLEVFRFLVSEQTQNRLAVTVAGAEIRVDQRLRRIHVHLDVTVIRSLTREYLVDTFDVLRQLRLGGAGVTK